MKRLSLAAIRLYQRRISADRPPSCRFAPTCSEYSAQAIEYYGVVRGGAKTAWRILRCNPFSAGGYDPPVPERQPTADGTSPSDIPAGG